MKEEILVGTQKGLLILEKKKNWKIKAVHFKGLPISMAYIHPLDQSWWVALAHKHWGVKLHVSHNQGESWEAIPSPKYPKDAMLRPGKPAQLRLIWAISHAGLDRPGHLYVGTEPGGLFKTEDYGKSFELVEALWNHPSRPDHWFGTGSDYPGIHSIVVDPTDSNHVYIAVSCAGVFETRDNGRSWEPRNKGLVAAYLPNPNVEVGHDPHRLLLYPQDPTILWQQNHCGIFRSKDGGENWSDITDQNGLANYGFTMVIDAHDPLRAWVVPATSDAIRVAPDLALCVCYTDDGGKSWQALRNGLPQQNCFDIVFRHAMVRKGTMICFGTNNGNVYLSEDDGEQWQLISGHLARVNVIV